MNRRDPDTEQDPRSADLDERVPNIARVYDYLLGGKDNYAADREFAERLVRDTPIVHVLARENRRFLARAVRFLARDAGITQFVDVGSGLPTAQNVHQVAQSVNPQARVVYVDHDVVVLVHAKALLATDDVTRVVHGDLNDPAGIIGAPETRELIDFNRPFALIFGSVLHFVEDAESALAPWRQVMAPGSHLVISHGLAERLQKVTKAYKTKLNVGAPRAAAEIADLFAGLDLLAPGLVSAPAWRPDAPLREHLADLPMLAGVGRVR